MSQQIVPSDNKWLPQVVDDNGKPVVGPELDSITKMMVSFAQLAQLAHIRKSVESQNFQGMTDPRDVYLSPGKEKFILDLVNLQPFTPWTYALFENVGPNDITVSLNDPFHPFAVHAGVPLKINRLGAAQRISIIYYEVQPGGTAAVATTGEY